MKSLYVTIVLFTTLILLTVANAIFLNRSVQAIVDSLENIPDPDHKSFNKSFDNVRTEWQKLRRVAKYSCYYSEISTIDILFDQLPIYINEENLSDYYSAKSALEFHLNSLARLEKGV